MLKRGPLYVLTCYILWGLLPVFWKLLTDLDSLYVLAARIVFSLVFIAAVLAFGKERSASVAATFRDRRELGRLAVGVTFAGIVIAVARYRQIPWVALLIGATFAIYGAIKKGAHSDAGVSVFFETLTLAPVALVFLLVMETRGAGAVGVLHGWRWLLLPAAGVVTTVPLLFFAKGIKTTPMSLSGILLYINPTMQLLLSVLLYGEEFTMTHAILFGFVWSGLVLYLVSSALQDRKRKKEEAPCA